MEEAQPTSKAQAPGPALRFVAAALIVRDGEVLIGQRRADQPMALAVGVSGRKDRARRKPASRRWPANWSKNWAFEADVGPPVTRIRHNYRHGGAVDLQFFAVREFTGEIDNQIYQQVRWVRLEDLPGYDFWPPTAG